VAAPNVDRSSRESAGGGVYDANASGKRNAKRREVGGRLAINRQPSRVRGMDLLGTMCLPPCPPCAAPQAPPSLIELMCWTTTTLAAAFAPFESSFSLFPACTAAWKKKGAGETVGPPWGAAAQLDTYSDRARQNRPEYKEDKILEKPFRVARPCFKKELWPRGANVEDVLKKASLFTSRLKICARQLSGEVDWIWAWALPLLSREKWRVRWATAS